MYYPEGKDPRAGKRGTLQDAWKLFPKHHAENEYFQKWLGGITDADYVVGTYKGSVSWLDKHVGEVVDRLRKNGLWENTLLIFTADHGESLGEHGLWFLHGGLYEPTARIPLIIRVPGGPQGKTVQSVVPQVDIMPTILARLGLPTPKQARGKDLWPTLAGQTLSGGAALLEHAGFYFVGLVTPRYKYIRHRTSRRVYPAYDMKKGREELYDLDADPAEQNNIAAANPDLLEEMRSLMKTMKAKKKVDFQAGKADIDEDTEEMLRSLGYTQ
jgi:arylsulfatase A-like enzyme